MVVRLGVVGNVMQRTVELFDTRAALTMIEEDVTPPDG